MTVQASPHLIGGTWGGQAKGQQMCLAGARDSALSQTCDPPAIMRRGIRPASYG